MSSTSDQEIVAGTRIKQVLIEKGFPLRFDAYRDLGTLERGENGDKINVTHNNIAAGLPCFTDDKFVGWNFEGANGKVLQCERCICGKSITRGHFLATPASTILLGNDCFDHLQGHKTPKNTTRKIQYSRHTKEKCSKCHKYSLTSVNCRHRNNCIICCSNCHSIISGTIESAICEKCFTIKSKCLDCGDEFTSFPVLELQEELSHGMDITLGIRCHCDKHLPRFPCEQNGCMSNLSFTDHLRHRMCIKHAAIQECASCGCTFYPSFSQNYDFCQKCFGRTCQKCHRKYYSCYAIYANRYCSFQCWMDTQDTIKCKCRWCGMIFDAPDDQDFDESDLLADDTMYDECESCANATPCPQCSYPLRRGFLSIRLGNNKLIKASVPTNECAMCFKRLIDKERLHPSIIYSTPLIVDGRFAKQMITCHNCTKITEFYVYASSSCQFCSVQIALKINSKV